MSYDLPTAAELKTRFPAFGSVGDARVSAFIDEAKSYVGTSWIETDYQLGIMAAAAHNMAMEGEPVVAGIVVPSTLLGAGIKRRKVGDVETEYNVAAPSSGGGLKVEFSTTPYGRIYLRLARLNGSGPRVV